MREIRGRSIPDRLSQRVTNGRKPEEPKIIHQVIAVLAGALGNPDTCVTQLY